VIRREGDRIVVSGAVTLANVTELLRRGNAELQAGASTVDLGEVTELNSALLAILFAWLREARRNGTELAFVRLPESLTTMARLYGVLDLLPGAASGA